MTQSNSQSTVPPARRKARRIFVSFTLSLLLIEFLDELVFGVREAAWPLIRDDLRLSYTEIGILLSVPGLLANLVEPFLGILGDVWRRRFIILSGGVVYTLALLLTSASGSFPVLLCALILMNPAAGAFVSLSQASLMDAAPLRLEQNMARWTLFGSLGNVAGPLLVGASVGLQLGWRWLFAAMAGLFLLMLASASRFRFATGSGVEARSGTEARSDAETDAETKTYEHAQTGGRVATNAEAETSGQLETDAFAVTGERVETGAWAGLKVGIRGALRALRRREVLRWLVLLEFGDFTWDILRGFLALYFVDVLRVSEAQAALAVVVWTCVGLPGDFLLIPLLERVRGVSYLRWSTLATLALFPAFLLADGLMLKYVLLGLLGFANAGWYSILKAQLYASMPGQSGTVMTLGNLSGLAGGLLPLALGAFAQRYGLASMMWLLLVGPAALLAGLWTLPRETSPRRISA